MRHLRTNACSLLALILLLQTAHGLDVSGLGQLSYVDVNENDIWMRSWQQSGTGVTRYDDWNEDVSITQGALILRQDIWDALSLEATGLYYPDGEQRWGFTEAFLEYKPLSAGWRYQVRAGAFYPKFSRENVDIGWNSPYTYSYSAAQSWIAEEIRPQGIEISAKRPGSVFQSPWTWDLRLALFSGNDGAGSLLAWRGWALHDRQTRLGEKIQFAQYPSFMGSLSRQPSFVRPLIETDDRLGLIGGIHIDYAKRHELRTYYYNNFGNATIVENNGQYAWKTQFASLAWFSDFDGIHLLAQWLQGDTLMGKKVVDNDFYSGYLMISTALSTFDLPEHRISLRHDRFGVFDKDDYGMDINRSEGQAWTFAWRYNFAESHQVGFEWLHVHTHNENRRLWGWPEREQINQIQLNFQYFFRDLYIN